MGNKHIGIPPGFMGVWAPGELPIGMWPLRLHTLAVTTLIKPILQNLSSLSRQNETLSTYGVISYLVQ